MLRSAVSRQAWGFNFTLTPIIPDPNTATIRLSSIAS